VLALVDGDIVAYRTAAVCENAAEGIARWQADQTITRIIEETDASEWKIYLSGDNNFRYKLFPDYKANRREMVRPKWLETLREHIVLEWDATVTDGYEADDALGIESTISGSESIVCTIDKDLKQLPGNHYHFVNRTGFSVSTFEGWYNFYFQLLVGDSTDNIRGCPGIGPVRAAKALGGCTTVEGMYEVCEAAYRIAHKETAWKELNLNAQLLYVWRKENDQWTPPKKGGLEAEVDVSSSIVTLPTSTELTTMEQENSSPAAGK
jgi:DNA polymerase-1